MVSGESSHFPWCIPPTLSFFYCNFYNQHTYREDNKTLQWSNTYITAFQWTTNEMGMLSQPPLLPLSLQKLPSCSWTCTDLPDIPLIYGSYVICNDNVHRVTGCLSVSPSVAFTLLQGRIEEERRMDNRYTVNGWLDKRCEADWTDRRDVIYSRLHAQYARICACMCLSCVL